MYTFKINHLKPEKEINYLTEKLTIIYTKTTNKNIAMKDLTKISEIFLSQGNHIFFIILEEIIF